MCGRSSIDPKKKTYSAPRPFPERKVGQVGRVEKYKCRIVAQGSRQINGIHYQESSSPTPTESSILISLAVMVLFVWKGWQLDVEVMFFEADDA